MQNILKSFDVAVNNHRIMDGVFEKQQGRELLKALLHNCVSAHFLVHWAAVCWLGSIGCFEKLCCHICHMLLNPRALQTQMLNSPSWISKAMLVIFCVITIMGLVTETGSKNQSLSFWILKCAHLSLMYATHFFKGFCCYKK